MLRLTCLSSCNYLPIYTKSTLNKVATKERYKGYQEGRAGELRRQVHLRQQEQEQLLPAKAWYYVPVDEHVNSEEPHTDN